MEENNYSVDREREDGETLRVRLNTHVKQVLWKLCDVSGDTKSVVVRRLITGAKIHPRLTEEEKEGIKALIVIEKNLVNLNNAIDGLAKNMTEAERKKFILNGKTLTEWTNVISEAIDFYKELKGKMLGK